MTSSIRCSRSAETPTDSGLAVGRSSPAHAAEVASPMTDNMIKNTEIVARVDVDAVVARRIIWRCMRAPLPCKFVSGSDPW